MAHKHQLEFVQLLSKNLSNNWSGKKVLEIGSYDVCGTVRSYFKNSTYLGVDLTSGPGVDIVCSGDQLDWASDYFDICLSCECFEHNPRWFETFNNMYRMTREGGVVLVTCASTGRPEHGTARTSPEASPGTQSVGWDYYKNLTEKDFRKKLILSDMFSQHFFLYNKIAGDLYFVGVKFGAQNIFPSDMEELKIMCEKLVIDLCYADDTTPRFKKNKFNPFRVAQLLALALPDRYYQNIRYHTTQFLKKIKFKHIE
jgi:hypothetical protein